MPLRLTLNITLYLIKLYQNTKQNVTKTASFLTEFFDKKIKY